MGAQAALGPVVEGVDLLGGELADIDHSDGDLAFFLVALCRAVEDGAAVSLFVDLDADILGILAKDATDFGMFGLKDAIA